MILRGLFGLALVALIMPHESGLGFSRPANAANIAPSEDWAARDSRHTEGGCGGRENSCMGALGMLAELQTVSMRSVSEVKADIEEAQRERAVLQMRRAGSNCSAHVHAALCGARTESARFNP